MKALRSKVAMVVVAAATSATIGGLSVASAQPGHGKHGPCEHGRHRHNPHCVTASPSSSSSSTVSPTPTETETEAPSPQPSESESSS